MANLTPKVAIITRTRGRGSLLTRALRSVRDQTYQDYIHIIVNDGGSRSVLEKILADFPSNKRKVIHNEDSLGGTVALNVGIKNSKSKYVAILDDDDTWHVDRLRTAIEYMEKHHSMGTASAMDKVYERVENGTAIEVHRDRWRPDITEINLYEQCLDNHLSNGCFIYRRKVYEELDGYDEKLDVAEDWEFGLRFLRKYDVDFINTQEALVDYHLRPEAKGELGNSVFDGIEKHRKAINMILNKYLRQDLNGGSLGLGYIINYLKFNEKKHKEVQQINLDNVVRIEGHVNRVEESLKKSIKDAKVHTFYEDVKRHLGH